MHSVLSKILESLPTDNFVRVHRSFIVNIDKIERIERNMIRMKDYTLPISKGQKEDFMVRIRQRGIFE